jgi:hypothetical protein
MAMIKKYVAKAIQRTRHLSSFLERFFTNPIAADFFLSLTAFPELVKLIISRLMKAI